MASTLPQEMQAQVLEEYNKPYQYRTVPVPWIASEHDLLIKCDAASYCHTDAVMWVACSNVCETSI
jgi:D-arabinose 1-dehydrogenase-like Zn-dependent alcohol dehydrogenase